MVPTWMGHMQMTSDGWITVVEILTLAAEPMCSVMVHLPFTVLASMRMTQSGSKPRPTPDDKVSKLS